MTYEQACAYAVVALCQIPVSKKDHRLRGYRASAKRQYGRTHGTCAGI